MLKRLLSKIVGAPEEPAKLSYEEARAKLESHAQNARHFLAGRPDVQQEILYYLASDASSEVRRLVAANPSTPIAASKILVTDADDEVRCELARKIGRLVPDLDPSETCRVRDLTIEVMERLAKDNLPRVRAILAEEIKSARNVPHHVVKTLAKDLELIVSAPVLEYSPLLSDSDLIEIIAGARVEGRLGAIARRANVSGPVADAIVATFDVSAIAALLANANAQIREDTLDRIVEGAAEVEAWHQPIVLRAELSARAIRRIAGFVASSLLQKLQERTGLDEDTASFVAKRVRERLDSEAKSESPVDSDTKAATLVQQALKANQLTDDFLIEAAERGDRRVVSHALAALCRLPKQIVDRILVSQSGKAIAALVWRAQRSMRVAVKIQTALAKMPSSKVVMAREGVHFPLTAEEMTWHLKYFGVTE